MSEGADDSSKTEEPTQKKLQKAHDEGQWPISQEVPTALMILGILLSFMIIIPDSAARLEFNLSYYFERATEFPMDAGAVGHLFLRLIGDILDALWLPMLVFMVAGAMGTVLQKGIGSSWKTVTPNLAKINPIAGFQRLFSLAQQAIDLAKSLAKIAVVGGVAYWVLMPVLSSIEHFVGMDLLEMLRELTRIAVRLLIGVSLVVCLIAAADLIYQRMKFTQQMRMTKQEVKDEYKEQEGDPQVKSRIRQLRIERVRKRMMAAVPKSDVVVTNPTHFSVALKYDSSSMSAPTVVAKGVDSMALRIRMVARDANVPIVANPPLARALHAAVEIDEEIPAEHYRAVAEIITYVMKLRQTTSA